MMTKYVDKLKKTYDENRAVVDATVKSDQLAFAEYLVAKHYKLAEELDAAKKAGKQPKALLVKVYKVYCQWKATQK